MRVRPESHRPVYRLAVTSLFLWAVAGAAYGTLRLVFGERPVYIHVRWAPALDDAARERLEKRHGLSLGELREGRTWGYSLTNLSRANIRALVLHPAVEDTHNIHRTKFRVGFFAPRRPYVVAGAGWMPVVLELLSVLLLLGGAVGMGLALIEVAAPTIRGPTLALRAAFLDPAKTSRRLALELTSWVRGRIPAASAESVALFRIVFGSALLVFLLKRPVLGAWAVDPENAVAPPRLALWLFIEAPWIADWIRPWLAFWGVLFIAGAMARTAFAMMTAAALAWAVLYTTRTTYHTVSALLLALVCLVWSRWGDAWSIDARRRHNQPRQAGTPQEYGYTVWVPSLVLGVVFAAAALAKLRESGLAWILNGTVKYHFLSDSRQAMVDWGLRVGPHDWVAVLLSFAAIVIESLVIVGVVSRAYRYRLAAGGAALSLLLGFSLLQGLFWPAWWILLLSFLPWHLVRPAVAPVTSAVDQTQPAPRSWRRLMHPAIVIAVIALVGQQIVVSVLKLEVAPLISTYDMYSTTYGSPAEYENKAGLSYWIVAVDDTAEIHECQVDRGDADIIVRAVAAASDRPETKHVLQQCFPPAVTIRSVSVEGRRAKVDWARWRRLDETVRIPLTEPIPAIP